MIKPKQLFSMWMLFFMCFYIAIAQENTTAHTVNRGETISDIAKIYNVTPYDILQANLGTHKSLDDLTENEVLIIPKSKIKSSLIPSAADAIKARATSTQLTYTVKKGETKYGLAKRFDVTINELEALNPHIVSGLNEGHILKINNFVDSVQEKSDNVAEGTTENVIFDGYRNHLVLKDETLWGIAHANGLTVDQLVSNNTDVLTGILKEGQTLMIPQLKPTSSLYISYLVKPGDTKFGLAKEYNSSIEELERLNPQIVKVLQIGHILRIPSESGLVQMNKNTTPSNADNKVVNIPITDQTLKKSETISETTLESKIPNQVEDVKSDSEKTMVSNSVKQASPTSQISLTETAPFYDYEVKPNETLYSLSQKAGMSITDFTLLNPQLKESVKTGAIIKMPLKGTSPRKVTNKSKTEESTSRFRDLSHTMITNKDKHILFLLPFTEAHFNDQVKNSNGFNAITDEFQKEHLEFYAGAKIAVDSIKKMGLNVDYTILEVDNKKGNSNSLSWAKDQNPTSYDAILVPFYGQIEQEIATMVSEQNVPVITNSPIAYEQNADNLFSAMPSLNEQRKSLLDFMTSKDGNIIMVSDVNRAESRDFISDYVPYAKFVDLKQNGTFTEDELISLFNNDKINYVIVDSERNSVFLHVTNILLSEIRNYSLQLAVLDSRIIPNNNEISLKRFRILKMLYPSLNPAETNTNLDSFKRAYQTTYRFLPTPNAIMGFDITFDTLLRLSQQQSFETTAKNDITEYIRYKFQYKKNNLGGYSNEGVYILQYDSNLNLQETD